MKRNEKIVKSIESTIVKGVQDINGELVEFEHVYPWKMSDDKAKNRARREFPNVLVRGVAHETNVYEMSKEFFVHNAMKVTEQLEIPGF